jgi:hypothetical protein
MKRMTLLQGARRARTPCLSMKQFNGCRATPTRLARARNTLSDEVTPG